MHANEGTLNYWFFGPGLAILAYACFSVRLAVQIYAYRRVDGIGFAMLSASLATLAWSMLVFFVNVLEYDWEMGAQAADVLRYFWWCFFILLFLQKG